MNLPALKFRLLKVGHCRHPECVAMRGGSLRSVMFPALCALIEHPTRGFILYDTGYSEHFFNATAPLPERLYRWVTPVSITPGETLPAQLRRLGIAPADIGHVLISHFHGDHVAGIRDYPNARFTSMRADFDAMRNASRLGNLLKGQLPALLPSNFEGRLAFAEDARTVALPVECRPFEHGFDLFGDASLLAVPLPGHTRGQMGLLLRQADGRMLFLVADACWTVGALERNAPPAWIAARIFDSASRYRNTFRMLRTLAQNPDHPTLVPSHCAQTWKAFTNEAS